MDKIASARQLTHEIQRILAYTETPNPSRARIAQELARLSERVAAFSDGSVETFLHILKSHLTQWDQQHGNAYSLGILLEAAEKAERDMGRHVKDQSPEVLEKFKTVLQHHFNQGFAPMSKTIQAINLFLKNGKPPKYPVAQRYRR